MIRPLFIVALLGSVLFAYGHTQPALYYSNQNQYFLHGLAHAGLGHLDKDWLANTIDPTPIFSLCIQYGMMIFGPWCFHVAFFTLLMLYSLSIWFIVLATPWKPESAIGHLAWWAGFSLVHSGLVRAGSCQVFGVDYPWYFQAGVANQYLLGAGLQPSVFGVLLLTSVAFYAHGKPRWAAVLAALACVFHSTYLLHAGLLVGAIFWNEVRQKRPQIAMYSAGIALLIVLPILIQTYHLHLNTNAKLVLRAQEIIVRQRIPHHCLMARWLDIIAGMQLLWCGLGLWMIRKESWSRMLVLPGLAAGLLTLAQSFLDLNSLALLFPWRLSAVLVPFTTAIVMAWLVQYLSKSASVTFAVIAGFTIVIGTAFVYSLGWAYPTSPAEEGLLQHVRQTHQPNDVYLFSTKFPKPTTVRGTSSASFVPLGPNSSAIFELQRFRLETGAAIYVDFKSIPYNPTEVHEWHRRVQQVEEWYAQTDWDEGPMAEIRAAGITKVVLPANSKITSRRWNVMYEDAAFKVMELKR